MRNRWQERRGPIGGDKPTVTGFIETSVFWPFNSEIEQMREFNTVAVLEKIGGNLSLI